MSCNHDIIPAASVDFTSEHSGPVCRWKGRRLRDFEMLWTRRYIASGGNWWDSLRASFQTHTLSMIACLVPIQMLSGCAIHSYDKKTGTEHVWGIGHVALRVIDENEGLQGVVRETEFVGLALSSCPEELFIGAGYNKQQRLHIIDADAQIRLEWPTADMLNIRIGSEFPYSSNNAASDGAEDGETSLK